MEMEKREHSKIWKNCQELRREGGWVRVLCEVKGEGKEVENCRFLAWVTLWLLRPLTRLKNTRGGTCLRERW